MALEITDLNLRYLSRGELKACVLPRGTTWLDAGTHHSLLEAGNLVKAIQERQGSMIACIEEIAWRSGWIDSDQLAALATGFGRNGYRRYLGSLVDGLETPHADL